MKYSIHTVCLLVVLLTACKATETVHTAKEHEKNAKNLATLFNSSTVFSGNFTGFELYDPTTDSVLYARNEKHYFTPASNTKLFTFYTALKILPEKLPALKYVVRGDSLIFWGTGDPSFLRSDLDDGSVYHFLKNNPHKLYYSDTDYQDTGLGPGWSWDDYQYGYSTERSPLPMYGNLVHFTIQRITSQQIKSDSTGMKIFPSFFKSHTQRTSVSANQTDQSLLSRGFSDNQFRYIPQNDTSTVTVEKPYHYTPQFITNLLSDTLHKPVKYVQKRMPVDTKTIYSVWADTVYKHMLQPSDNFIAEQLLLVTAAELSMPLNTKRVINKIKSTFLKKMPDAPQWVDGSGLSRYNLFTPRSMVWLLQKIDEEFSADNKLFDLLPAGGESGTLKDWYGSPDGGPPYVFAKTGTLSNNYCLAGFLITESGRKLLFSFMNNHYITSSSVVKQEIEKVLWYIHQHY